MAEIVTKSEIYLRNLHNFLKKFTQNFLKKFTHNFNMWKRYRNAVRSEQREKKSLNLHVMQTQKEQVHV